jgi:hypothetical protein
MQYLVTATEVKITDAGSFAIVKFPRFLLDSGIDMGDRDPCEVAREIMGHPKNVKVMVMPYHPRREV